eukprot:TRINITY_DN23946_c0_g1_i2.p1 TRINITY_DN23946_c0_g1~~TRINITY_DN23946_c0_g1_i2.p1  ORF type:complete len:281 (-),score=61.12 TRINITY_DN23946_c0_g1_i2:9-851(-)
MEHVRFLPELRLQPEEQKLLLRLEQKAVASATTRGPAHFMVSGHGVCDEESAEALDEAGRRDIEATRALAEHLASIVSPGLDVISVRLLISPPGAPEQPWHLDYARQFREVHTLFVPLTPSTEETCTELLELQKPSADIAEIARAAHGPLPVEAWRPQCEGEPAILALVLDEWQCCVARTSHVFHRRSANTGAFTRITFNVDMASLRESPNFVDVDCQRSLLRARLCPQAEVDELEEQDASLVDFDESGLRRWRLLARGHKAEIVEATRLLPPSATLLAA